MKTTAFQCPNCSAVIQPSDGDYSYCPYCGTAIDNYDKRIKIHTVKEDIAAIKAADARLKELQDKENIRNERRESRRKFFQICSTFSLIFWVLLLVFFLIQSQIHKKEINESIAAGKISAGFYQNYIGIDCYAAEETLEALGFDNITMICLDDASIFKRGYKKDTVALISINGNAHFLTNDYFWPDDQIIIHYH